MTRGSSSQATMPTRGPPTFFLIFLLVVVSNVIDPSEANTVLVVANGSATVEKMVPLMKPGEMRMGMVFNESRRKLGSFQICALCTCCGGARGVCLPSPCCYAINCNIPNRPFGFCSFTPRTCNCFGCHI